MTAAANPPLSISGTVNFRDVGGYAAAGGTVRSGRLYRSDALSELGAAGGAAFDALEVASVVDLRDGSESSVMPDDVRCTIVSIPLLAGSANSFVTAMPSLEELYRSILDEQGESVVRAVRAVIEAGEGASVVHCTAGKDRTGTIIALILLALGVDREQVIADYAASQQNLAGPWVDAMTIRVRSAGIPITPELLALLGSTPPSAMATMIDHLKQRWGTAADYLLGAGLQQAELAELRRLLLA